MFTFGVEDVLTLVSRAGFSAVAVSEQGEVFAQRGEERIADDSEERALIRIVRCSAGEPALGGLLSGGADVCEVTGENGRWRIGRVALQGGGRMYLLSPIEAALDGWTLARAARVREVSSVLHEVATNLTAVTGWLEVARAEPGRMHEALSFAEESAGLAYEAARGVLRSLRVSRSDTGLLDDLVRRAALSQGAVAARRGIRIAVTEGAPSALASRAGIWAIVTTLVENAIDASPDGSAIEVRTSAHNGGYAIAVEDRGAGMPVGTPSAHISSKPQGSGLGLQTVRRVALDLGASLSFKPAEPTGTIATIEVPLGRSLAGTRVLVVEDDPRLRKLLGDFLRGRGASVTDAASAHETTTLSSEFDVVVVDRTLPDGQGDAVLSALAARLPDAARVLVSGGTEPADLSRSLPSGTVWLRKPFAPADLVEGIARAMGHASAQGSPPESGS